MNKFVTFIVIVFFLGFLIYFAAALGYETSDMPSPVATTGLLGYIRVFWDLLTFNVPDMPAIVTILFIYPATMGLFYMGAALIRGGS